MRCTRRPGWTLAAAPDACATNAARSAGPAWPDAALTSVSRAYRSWQAGRPPRHRRPVPRNPPRGHPWCRRSPSIDDRDRLAALRVVGVVAGPAVHRRFAAERGRGGSRPGPGPGDAPDRGGPVDPRRRHAPRHRPRHRRLRPPRAAHEPHRSAAGVRPAGIRRDGRRGSRPTIASCNTGSDRCAGYARTGPRRQSSQDTPSCRTCAADTMNSALASSVTSGPFCRRVLVPPSGGRLSVASEVELFATTSGSGEVSATTVGPP